MAKLGKTKRQGDLYPNSQGIGYYIPDSMSVSEWRELKQKWDQKLSNSGFSDIELFSHALDGHFLPTFSKNSIEKNQKSQTEAVTAGYSGYYDYCSTFYEHADFKALFDNSQFNRKWSLCRELMRLHKDGVSYGDMRIALTCRQSSYMKRFNVAASSEQFRQKRSKYWLFVTMEKILAVMWLWHCTSEHGQLTPYDLEHMDCTGLTPEVVAAAKALYKPRATDE